MSKHFPLSKVTEVTFSIRDLTITNGDRLTLATDTSSVSSAYWHIELIPYVNNASDSTHKDSLQVLVSFKGSQWTSLYDISMPRDIDLSLYKSMHLVPVADATKALSFPVGPSGLSAGNSVEGRAPLASLRTSPDELSLSFDVIFSTEDTMARKPHYSPIPSMPPIKNQDILPCLLKDPHSVDVCILFPNDKKYPNHGLWAHRLVLERNKVFAKMLNDAGRQVTAVATVPATPTKAVWSNETRTISPPATTAAGRGAGVGLEWEETSLFRSCTTVGRRERLPTRSCNPSHPRFRRTIPNGMAVRAAPAVPATSTTFTPLLTTTTDTNDTKKRSSTLTLVIEKHSLATFCSLLRFVYTGQLDYSNRYSDFVFSINMSSSSPFLQSRDFSSIRWTRLPDEKCVWTVAKEEQLMLCAHEFGIDDLEAGCRARMELSMSETNIGHILFDVVPVYPKIKTHAMMYVVRNKEMLFASGKDLFEQFRTYPQCHSVMLEIFQHMATRLCTRRSATYVEFLMAAHHNGLHDVVQFCEGKIVAGLSEVTICRVLLNVVPLYPRNHGGLLRGGSEMFADHKSHPNCYKMMLEVMQLMLQNLST
ncbi:hypothetical protein BGZ96_004442 [Linnemannia gamsii]|uniref:BTB domain-containing protein n=1 Tax=Linnemannia gamsii TaxID=64522 RepID=A0ABQ7JI84_9FUNG|nr:hypothetical protein BGZ96_004442 [Linnemannia gamsii]